MTGPAKTYLSDFDPVTFNWCEYFDSRLPGYWTNTPEQKSIQRIEATRHDPLLFGLVYCRKVLTDEKGQTTLSDMHADICRIARHLRLPLDQMDPLAFAVIAPRNSGKSSWLFSVIILWLAAHKHRSFVAYLASSGVQAERWTKNFKRTLDSNELVREDYPELCVPAKRVSTGRAFNDDNHLYAAENGFKLASLGIDNENLGLNLDSDRPDLLIFDDIESHGGKYSLYQMNQRLEAVNQTIPMGQPGCSIFFVGTVNMPGSILDQLREYGEKSDPSSWIATHKLRVRHYLPFVYLPSGERRSFWPARWTLKYLESIEGTRYFAVAFLNEPLPENGEYWRENDIQHGTTPVGSRCITFASLDPAVKTRKQSDFTALSIVRYDLTHDKYEVLYGRAFKLNPGVEMPQYVLNLLTQWPEVVILFVEDNQAGDLWKQFYGSIPGVQLHQVFNSKLSKEQRAAMVLRMYQTGRVFHSDAPGADVSQLEKEQYGFPRNLHDDLPDSVCTGILSMDKLNNSRTNQDRESYYV